MMIRCFGVLAFCGLAACGTAIGADGPPVDDPANPALRGAWTIETRVASIEYEGRRFSPAHAREGGDLTDLIQMFERPLELACVEPSLTMDEEAANDSIVACFSGEQGPDGKPVPDCFGGARGTVRATGQIDAETGQVALTLVPPEGGRRDTDRMTFNFNRTLRRTGDCR